MWCLITHNSLVFTGTPYAGPINIIHLNGLLCEKKKLPRVIVEKHTAEICTRTHLVWTLCIYMYLDINTLFVYLKYAPVYTSLETCFTSMFSGRPFCNFIYGHQCLWYNSNKSCTMDTQQNIYIFGIIMIWMSFRWAMACPSHMFPINVLSFSDNLSHCPSKAHSTTLFTSSRLCLTQRPASLCLPTLILPLTLSKVPYRHSLLAFSLHNTFIAILSIRV